MPRDQIHKHESNTNNPMVFLLLLRTLNDTKKMNQGFKLSYTLRVFEMRIEAGVVKGFEAIMFFK